MREETGWLFTTGEGLIFPDAVCIATSDRLDMSGHAVLPGTHSKQALELYPGIAKELGRCLAFGGNNVYILSRLSYHPILLNFPVAADGPVDMALVLKSARLLAALANLKSWERVNIPRVGCDTGELEWSVVKPLLQEILDDRFVVVTR